MQTSSQRWSPASSNHRRYRPIALRVVFRVCRIGVKSTVVSRAEEEALNQLALIGDDGDARAIDAKLFTLVDKNVEEVEAELRLAVQWAGWTFGGPKVLYSLPQERRYGYASTEQDDGDVNAAIEATKANWLQWQDIARQSTVNVHWTTADSDASMPPTVESLSVECPSPRLSPRGKATDDRICVCESRELRHSRDSPWRSARPTGGAKKDARRQATNLAAVGTVVGQLAKVVLVVGALGSIAVEYHWLE